MSTTLVKQRDNVVIFKGAPETFLFELKTPGLWHNHTINMYEDEKSIVVA